MNVFPPIRNLLPMGVLVLAMVALGGCTPDNPTLPEGAPPSHTVVRGGVAHMDGLNEPTSNCARCHGHQLTGGADGEPSCYECHDRVW